MSQIAFPPPDAAILARRDEIIAALAAVLPPDCLVTSQDAVSYTHLDVYKRQGQHEAGVEE